MHHQLSKCIVLKAGKEKSVQNRHPWIFSGAIEQKCEFANGEILPFYSSSMQLLGHAYFHTENSIAGRILSFGSEDPIEAIQRKFRQCAKMRQELMPSNVYRVVNAEGDGLPGLIVDRYDNVVVIQINTCGMELLRDLIVSLIIETFSPESIFEKSTSQARKLEGLKDVKGLVFGPLIAETTICENGIEYIVPIETGQKTGFFLDQREMRKKILEISHGKKVLNCFAYVGGFSLAALKGGAVCVDSVEISKEACAICLRNNFDPKIHKVIQSDALEFLKTSPLDYDIVILDPPAFAKKRNDVASAYLAYKEMNKLVLSKMPHGSMLLTCSCSSYMTYDLFQKMLFQAAEESGRSVQIISRHIQSADHPISVFHPEGDYLKSALVYVSSL